MSSDSIVVLPLGAHEYHGPHLPLDTDTRIARSIAQKAEAGLPPDISAHFLKAEPVGYSVEHMRRKGTRTLTYENAIARWIAIGKKQYDKGVRKFVMLNAHGGNAPLMTIVATELRCRFNMLAVATSWTRFGLPAGLITAEQQALDIHAGFIETSVMLAIAPESVKMQKAADFHNAQGDMAQEFTWLRAYGKHAFGWIMDDLNAQGAAGDARKAEAATGKKILDHAAAGFVQLLTDIHHFDVKRLV